MSIFQSGQFTFVWENKKSVIQNFTEWYTLNCEERSAYNEDLMSREEALQVFENLYKVKVDK